MTPHDCMTHDLQPKSEKSTTGCRDTKINAVAGCSSITGTAMRPQLSPAMTSSKRMNGTTWKVKKWDYSKLLGPHNLSYPSKEKRKHEMADGSISVSICKNVSYVRVGWVVFLTSTPRMKLVQLLSWRAANSHPWQILQHVRIGYNPVETANVKNETEPPPHPRKKQTQKH